MPQQPANNPNSNSTKPGFRFPLFVKPGALATRIVSASKSFLSTFGGNGPVTGLETGNGLFSGYRPTNTNFGNIPISRFQSVNEYLGAYGSIAAVYTCVSTIANSIAGLPTDFVDQSGKTIATLGQKPAEDDSLAGLLENPNDYQDWYALRETIAAHLELCGNALVLMDDMDGLGRPANLYPLNPAYIQLAVSPDSGLLGYIYQPGGATRTAYSVDEVLHFKMANPSSIFWGQGTLQALAGNLNTEIDILDSVNALYRNGAVIPGAFVSKEVLADTEFTKLKAQLMQEHTGSGNFFKPLLLDGGLDWKSMSIGHTDLGTTEIRRMNREEIYMGFGVPVSQAGNQGHANVKNDHLTDVFWLTTIGPKVHRIEAGFKKLTKRYDPRYSIKMPLPVKVAEAEMLDNVTKVDTLTSLSVSEKRKAIKTITGDQFGWGNIPDLMPVEAGDPNAPQDPNADPTRQLPPPTDDGSGEPDPMADEEDTGPDLEQMPLAQAVLDAGIDQKTVQDLVDAGVLDESYLSLFDTVEEDGKGLRNLAHKLGYTMPGQGVRTVKKPGSRGGHPWTDAHGNTHYGPQPKGTRGHSTTGKPAAKKPASAGAHKPVAGHSTSTGKKPAGAAAPKKRTSTANAGPKKPPSVRTAQKQELKRINSMLQSGKDKFGNDLHPSSRTAMSKITQKLRDDLYAKKYAGEGKAVSADVTAHHTGIMVAFYLPSDVSETLALKGGEAPEELHLTLGYLGDSTEMDPDLEIDLYETIKEFADCQEPVSGQISGIGLFLNTDEGNDTNAFYASFDSSQLPDFRTELIEELQEAEIPVVLNHGFTPHVTLAYVPVGKPLPVASVPVTKVTFDRITVKWGDNRVDFPLRGLAPALDDDSEEEEDTGLITEDAKAAVWDEFDAKATDLEGDFASDLAEILAESIDEILQGLDLDQPGQESKGLGISLGIQKLGDILINKLTQAAVPHLTQAVIAGYLDATMSNLNPSSGKVAKEAKSRAAQMAETVWQNTKEAIQTITESGKPRKEQVREIEKLFDRNRAEIVAGTETVSALNYGKKSGYDATGQKSQMWVTRRDHRVRYTHTKADGQVSDGDFEVGGYKLKYPGDPDAPAKERVMCRCTLMAVPGEQ